MTVLLGGSVASAGIGVSDRSKRWLHNEQDDKPALMEPLID